jgi:twitching motility protein PilT
MVNHLNENEYGHVLTVEDPIEFVHESKKCLINQREVGPHTLSFSNALRSALREDPDAILVGEMRDLETIRLALTAAETGHLVFGTLHTSSARQDHRPHRRRLPGGREGDGARDAVGVAGGGDLADAAARLKDGSGRVAAHEIMIGTPAIQQPHPREQGRPDVLGHPDRPAAWACRRWTRTSPTSCGATSSRPAEARCTPRCPENFPG